MALDQFRIAHQLNLGITPNVVVHALNPPPEYSETIAPLPGGAAIKAFDSCDSLLAELQRRRPRRRTFHCFVISDEELLGIIPTLTEVLRYFGEMWLFWPAVDSAVRPGLPSVISGGARVMLQSRLHLKDTRTCGLSSGWVGVRFEHEGGRPLFHQLGIAKGMTIHVLWKPASYAKLIDPCPSGVRIVSPESLAELCWISEDHGLEFVHCFVHCATELSDAAPPLAGALAINGTLWMSW